MRRDFGGVATLDAEERPQSKGWRYRGLKSQRIFHRDTTTRYKGYSGPIGSGKSYALVYEAIFLSRINAGLLGLLGAPTYPMLRDATQATFFEVLDLEEIPYVFNKTENKITFLDSGSTLIFRSVDEFERLRGTNLAWFGVDELTYCPEGAWLRLEGRLRHPHAKRLAGFAVWTPKGYDWVYRKFVEKGDANYRLIRATPAENKHLPSDFYERLRDSYDERFFRQEALGEYLDITGGAVYHAYSAANKTLLGYDPGLPLIWSLDFNVDPMCSVICQIRDVTDRLDAQYGRKTCIVSVLDEICLPDSYTEAACEEFKRRTLPWIRNRQLMVHVYGDASGGSRKTSNRSDYQIIKEAFAGDGRYRLLFKNKGSNPPVKDRLAAVNAMLCNAAGERHLFHDPKCLELTRDFNQVKWKKDMNGLSTGDLDKSDLHRTHVSDALGYLIEAEFGLHPKGGPRSTYIA